LETLGEIRGFSFYINTKKGNYMDPITKALHETWKNIISERYIGIDEYIKPKPAPGGRINPDLIMPRPIRPGLIEPGISPFKPKPTPTPGDGSWGGSKPTPGTGAWGGGQPKKPKYGPDGNFIGFDDGTTPTPTPKPKPEYDRIVPGELPKEPSPKSIYWEHGFKPNYEGDGDGKYLRAAKEAAVDQIKPDFIGAAGPGGYKTQPIIPTRTPAPQPAVPATTGSGLLNSILNTNKKMYNSVTGSLPSMPKIYEERDAEGQMAMGELKVLAQKAQELAGMMKDDTQLEGWVQSKITKAKDYISSVHDYMNGNPDKID
jgi:hypothetical protein